MDCIFCKLASGLIETQCIYEDDKVFAFKDMAPCAPIHYLFIPKEHIESLQAANDSQIEDLSYIFKAIKKVAERDGFADKGYRIVNNIGRDGNQSVPHMHFHVLAGEPIRFKGFDN